MIQENSQQEGETALAYIYGRLKYDQSEKTPYTYQKISFWTSCNDTATKVSTFRSIPVPYYYHYAHRYYINSIPQKPDFEPDVRHVNSYRIIIGSRYIGNWNFYRAEKNTSSLSKSGDFDTDLQPDFLKISTRFLENRLISLMLYFINSRLITQKNLCLKFKNV